MSGICGDATSHYALMHRGRVLAIAGLMKGTDENYRWMGVTWPDSRYLVITLSGEVERAGPQKPTPTIYGWHCRYDLRNGTFDVPAEFTANNAKALAPPDTR